MKDFPLISEALLEALNKSYPDKCPNPNQTDREIWMAVGARRVVEFLQGKHKQQTEKVAQKG